MCPQRHERFGDSLSIEDKTILMFFENHNFDWLMILSFGASAGAAASLARALAKQRASSERDAPGAPGHQDASLLNCEL